MGFKRVLNSRIVAVGAGATALAVLAGGVGYAAGEIGSNQIKDNSVRSADIRDESLKVKDLNPGFQRKLEKSAFSNMQADALEDAKAIENIGGAINDNSTNLGVGLDLAPGRYLVTVDGAFLSGTAAADGTPAVYPQLSLWIDKNDDDAFTWQTEGDISPNALMPAAADRHVSTHGSTLIEVTKETHVGLLAFGYAADGSAARAGEIDVNRAVLTATPLPN